MTQLETICKKRVAVRLVSPTFAMSGALTWQVKSLMKILFFGFEERWHGDLCPALSSVRGVFLLPFFPLFFASWLLLQILYFCLVLDRVVALFLYCTIQSQNPFKDKAEIIFSRSKVCKQTPGWVFKHQQILRYEVRDLLARILLSKRI